MTAVAFGGTTSENKLWTPTFVLLFFVNLLSSLAFYLLMVVIAEYALNAYGVSLALAGMAVSVFVVGGLVSRFAFGGQIDRLGCKKSLVIGLAVYTGASMLYFFDFGIAWLLFVRFLHGIGFGIASGSAAAAAALIVPVSRKGEGLGYFSMSQALSTAIGPFFAMLVMGASGGYTELFVITAGATGLALVLSFFVKICGVDRSTQKRRSSFCGGQARIRHRAFCSLAGNRHRRRDVSLSFLLLGRAFLSQTVRRRARPLGCRRLLFSRIRGVRLARAAFCRTALR